MRTIKFRGYDAVGKKGWVYGDLVHNMKVTETGVTPRVMVGSYEVHEDSIGQFSGLLDKNGKEIYEGDIMTMMRTPKKKRKRILVRHIITCESPTDWYFRSLDATVLNMLMSGFDHRDSYRFEVVGNIYDNPGLADE